MQATAEALPTQEKYFPELKRYRDFHQDSLNKLEEFWEGIASHLPWFKRWEKVLEWNPPFARWFVNGLINASYVCLDNNLKKGKGSKVAFFWEGEDGLRRVLSYRDLYDETNRLATALRDLGLKKGDRITLYLPMIPELPVAMLAAARLGVTFTAVFSGFSPQQLAERIRDSESKAVITADGGYRRGKVVPLKENVDAALREVKGVEKVVVVRRIGRDVPWVEGRDVWWHELLPKRWSPVEPEPLESNHLLYLLYSSGTTGKPKAIVHGTGGYLTYVYATMRWVFDVTDEDIYYCTADIGWVTGHSYIVFGPLAHGISSVMYEGAPDYPQPDRWWELVERYSVNIFYTTPTAIRALIKYGEGWPRKHDLSSLRLLGTVGEPINPEAWRWYYKVIGQERCPIVDTWWQTETGGIMISPAPHLASLPLKPGSATLPLPGIDADVLDEEGRPAPPGTKGYLVIKKPWPGMLLTLYRDEERYKQVYWSRFPGAYYPGDYAVKDEEGYFWLLGRADEVIKVAGHRLGTIEIEDALVAHPAVAEAAVTSRPHEVKGEAIICFVVLRQDYEPSPQLVEDLRNHVRNSIGPIATPEEIHIVKMLPKTRSGKIMRRVIKAVAAGTSIGDVTTLEDEASVEEIRAALEALKG